MSTSNRYNEHLNNATQLLYKNSVALIPVWNQKLHNESGEKKQSCLLKVEVSRGLQQSEVRRIQECKKEKRVGEM